MKQTSVSLLLLLLHLYATCGYMSIGPALPSCRTSKNVCLKNHVKQLIPPSRLASSKRDRRQLLRCSSESLSATTTEEQLQGGESQYWEWRNGWKIHYKKYGKGVPLLLLTGFGVGEFHYERNVDELSEHFEVWTMDVIGQGKSWPSQDPAPGGIYSKKGFEWGFGDVVNLEIKSDELTYSCQLWMDQVIDFIEQVVQRPCYIAGNSLGGYLAVMTASSRPELTKGLLLLNATPIWGVGVQKVLPWSGGYPVPQWVRPLTFTWWDGIRSSSTITSLLSFVYANKERIGSRLIDDIIEPTEHPAAASAFASILCSRGSIKTFDQMLGKIKEDKIPVTLLYGRDDPWIVPLWGFRAKRSLPHSQYYEITPAGHCPHHEVPEAINYLMREWIFDIEGGGDGNLMGKEEKTMKLAFDETHGKPKQETLTITLCDGNPRSVQERVDQWIHQWTSRMA